MEGYGLEQLSIQLRNIGSIQKERGCLAFCASEIVEELGAVEKGDGS